MNCKKLKRISTVTIPLVGCTIKAETSFYPSVKKTDTLLWIYKDGEIIGTIYMDSLKVLIKKAEVI